MKNLILILTVFIISSSFLKASSTPKVLISSAEIEVVTIESQNFFVDATFDESNDNLIFNTTKDISVVQIFNAKNEMEFQLPVMSSNVQINKNLFGEGNYKLGFLLEGQEDIHFTKVTIK